MKLTSLICIFQVLLISGCTFTNSKKESLPPPNIVWINAEDISPAFGCYGDNFAITPNTDALASKGIVYKKAFATAPICAPSRSCLATGLYATSMGTQHLRSVTPKPEFIKTLPEMLRNEGYFTSLSGKTDYNFDPTGVWEYWENDNTPWKKRKEGQPFYSMFVFGLSHEGAGNIREKYESSVEDLPKEMFHDPAKVKVPPYYPDNEKARELWARYYDLVSAFDQKVGEVVENLEADGLMENTFIFVFADHGFGMPRYKRWLNETGLKVPLVVYTPEKYKSYFSESPGSTTEDLVSFVDFVPTTLSLAGIPKTEYMPGNAFLGPFRKDTREYVFGARSRADDMFETSRSVRNDRFMYIRHYQPQYPYIQDGYIFSDVKEVFKLLREEHEAATLPAASERMWHKKPNEELYDLENDPYELNNLAESDEYQLVKDSLRDELKNWIFETRDIGFLPEAEYMIRSTGSTPYQYAQSNNYDLAAIYNAAEMVGKASKEEFEANLQSEDSGVRFWSVIGLLNLGERAKSSLKVLLEVLENDSSPSVQIAAAETLCKLGNCENAIPVLEKYLKDDRVWVALQAARTTQLIKEEAKPLVPVINEVLKKYRGEDGAKFKYKDFNYAAFISWPLEWSLKTMGEQVP
ncbi:sulfatase-like hydrolase/transferase [Chondrinema litorale]|uniref:sulfatase-like hydrolase/transferase n=1 Tax=Chondrinema litorale TaxID=2994555 RepID=UPI002542FA7E|nr:sulfatase-like hydrolase/transferase [Chondrinema litorale]UZR98733.1 sulfatase-like hydrolase/transferase [Chondrinema litorale]